MIKAPEIKKTGSSNAVFIGELFACRDLIHLAHLRSKSYAEHVALRDLYDFVLDFTDSLCEAIQSYVGILEITVPETKYREILPYLKKERTELIGCLKTYESMPDIQNKIQDLISAFSSAIYKLENLK